MAISLLIAWGCFCTRPHIREFTDAVRPGEPELFTIWALQFPTSHLQEWLIPSSTHPYPRSLQTNGRVFRSHNWTRWREGTDKYRCLQGSCYQREAYWSTEVFPLKTALPSRLWELYFQFHFKKIPIRNSFEKTRILFLKFTDFAKCPCFNQIDVLTNRGPERNGKDFVCVAVFLLVTVQEGQGRKWLGEEEAAWEPRTLGDGEAVGTTAGV